MEALGLDIKLLIAQLINFAVFFFIFSKIFAKPFVKYMEEQRNIQKEKERILHELEEREIKLTEKEKDILGKANSQALRIIADAKKHATEEREGMIADTQDEINVMRVKAKKQIDDEHAKMLKDVEGNVIRTTEALTKKILHEFLNDNKQTEIIDNLLRKINEK